MHIKYNILIHVQECTEVKCLRLHVQWYLCCRTSLYSYNSVFYPKKMSWNCVISRPDFCTRLTAKHVMNEYLSNNNNKNMVVFFFLFVEYSILHSI